MKKISTALLGIVMFWSINALAVPKLTYYLGMSEPHTHYFEVEMRISDLEDPSLDLKMASWTPGSYMIREFARHVEGFEAFTPEGKPLVWDKVSKNTWQIQSAGEKEIRVAYKVYAFENTVRTPFLDEDHAAVIGAGVFMYIDKYDPPSTINIQPAEGWSKISTALKTKRGNPWVLSSSGRDELFDSPIEIGNQLILRFDVAGIPHQMAIYGEGNYDTTRLKVDTRKIAIEATKVFGENPVSDYTIIIHNKDDAYGGLEHSNSTSLIYRRWGYQPYDTYVTWLGLMSHEYFHNWNIKRLRPISLGPFDYEKENYTHALWMVEGFTSYYDDMILLRSGLITLEKYLKIAASNVQYVENRPGDNVQSATEASFDAWIKYYQQNENSYNSTISYYSKGAVLACLLDLWIIHETGGKKNLDDVMAYMYKEYYKKKDRGYTNEELLESFEKISGVSMDNFFSDHIYGTGKPNYNLYYGYAGLKLVDDNEGRSDAIIGATIGSDNKVASVTRNGAAWNSGINVGDELISFDGYRLKNDISKYLAMKNEGDEVEVILSRDARIRKLTVVLKGVDTHKFRLEKLPDVTDEQKMVYRSWLRTEQF